MANLNAPCIPDGKVRIFMYEGMWFAEIFFKDAYPRGYRRHCTSPVGAYYKLRKCVRYYGNEKMKEIFDG